MNQPLYRLPGGTGIISHVLEKGKQAERSKTTCLEAPWIVWKMKNWYQKSFPSELILYCTPFLIEYTWIKSSLILVLTTSTYVSSANSKSWQEKGQSIYSCDPHNLKLAGRLAKHSVMLKLFPEQQASLQGSQLKGYQTCQPTFFQHSSFKIEWLVKKFLSFHIFKLVNQGYESDSKTEISAAAWSLEVECIGLKLGSTTYWLGSLRKVP